jgi:hypothetical protein
MSKKQIWFFDDDNRNAPSISNSKIHFMKVNRTDDGQDEPKSHYFARKINCNCNSNSNSNISERERKPVPVSGITETDILRLKKAIKRERVAGVIFDWDKTLLTRSLWFPQLSIQNRANISEYKKDLASLKGIEHCSDKEVADYFFHNPNDGNTKKDVGKRSKKIAAIFHHLQKMKIPIYILTNNLGARIDPLYNNRSVFTDLLIQIGVELPQKNIIYNTLQNKEQTIMNVILPKMTGSERKRTFKKISKKHPKKGKSRKLKKTMNHITN